MDLPRHGAVLRQVVDGRKVAKRKDVTVVDRLHAVHVVRVPRRGRVAPASDAAKRQGSRVGLRDRILVLRRPPLEQDLVGVDVDLENATVDKVAILCAAHRAQVHRAPGQGGGDHGGSLVGQVGLVRVDLRGLVGSKVGVLEQDVVDHLVRVVKDEERAVGLDGALGCTVPRHHDGLSLQGGRGQVRRASIPAGPEHGARGGDDQGSAFLVLNGHKDGALAGRARRVCLERGRLNRRLREEGLVRPRPGKVGLVCPPQGRAGTLRAYGPDEGEQKTGSRPHFETIEAMGND